MKVEIMNDGGKAVTIRDQIPVGTVFTWGTKSSHYLKLSQAQYLVLETNEILAQVLVPMSLEGYVSFPGVKVVLS